MLRDTDDLKTQLADAIQRSTEVERRVAEATDKVSHGDLFLFQKVVPGIEWAVILSHPDDDQLWFVVPADQNPMVGTWDIAVPSLAECGPLTLRCAVGLWVHADDFDLEFRSGFIESKYIDAARGRLSQMVSGNDVFVVETIDADPDYEEWHSEIRATVELLERAIQESESVAEKNTVRFSDFDQDWTARVAKQIQRGPTALAADSGGLASGPKEPFPTVSGKCLEVDVPGDVVVVQEGSGCRLQYFPESGEDPPTVEVSFESGEPATVQWRKTPDGFESQEPLTVIARIELIFGADQRVVIEP